MVEDIFGRIYDYKLDLTIHKPLLESMYDAIEWFISPLINQINRNLNGIGKKSELKYYSDSSKFKPGNLRQATSSKILYEDLPVILRCIGVNLAFHERLF